MKKQKNIFMGLLIALAVVCTGVGFSIPQTNTAHAEEEVGASTLSKVGGQYQIANANDLVKFSNDVNGGYSYDGETVVLTGNIDMSSVASFTPIGKNATNFFKGNFEGNGYTISDLTINNNDLMLYGLFGYVRAEDDVKINNFTIEDIKIQGNGSGQKIGGAVLAYCDLSAIPNTYETCDITNVTVTSTKNMALYSDTSSCYVGGIVGATRDFIGSEKITPDNFPTQILNIEFCHTDVKLSAYSESTINNYYGTAPYGTAGILAYGVAGVRNCYSVGYGEGNAVVSGLVPITDHQCTLFVVYCYDYIESRTNNPGEPGTTFVDYKFKYYTKQAKMAQDYAYDGRDVYQQLTWSQNANASRWQHDGTADGLPTLKAYGSSGGNNGGNTGGNTGGGESQKTSATLKVVQRYVDIANSSNGLAYTNITANDQILTYGQVFSITTPDGYTTDNLNKLSLPNAEFIGAGLDNIPTALPVKINYDHLEYSQLVVNYLNAKPIKINGVEYWIANGNDKLYKYSEGKFTEASLTDEALIPTAEGKYFLGWSTTKVDGTCELVNDAIGGQYVDWDTQNTEFVIRVERAGMSSNVNNTAVTGVKVVGDYATIDTSKLYAVWGELKLKLTTYAYAVIDGQYVPTTFVSITLNPTPTKTTTGYKIDLATNYTLGLTTKNNKVVEVGADKGYLSVKWLVGTVSNGVETPYSGSAYGTLGANNTATTTISGITKASAVTVILTPRTDITINISNNKFENSDKIYYTIDGNNVSDGTRLVYGVTYTVKINDLDYGWYIHNIDSEPKTDFSKKLQEFTFTVDFVGGVDIEVNIQESYFHNLIERGLLALLIVSVGTLVLAMIINAFKPPKDDNNDQDGEQETEKFTMDG